MVLVTNQSITKGAKKTMTQTPYAPPSANNLEADEKLCNTCNAVIHKKAEICPKCGVRQSKPASKGALLLLTFFFGSVGAHRFYLGNHLLGILYFLFFWTGIPGLIALIEFIVFAFTSSETIEDNYIAHGSAAVIAVIMMFISIMYLGILAAIAIPSYSDYMQKAVHKAKVLEAVSLLEGAKEVAFVYYVEDGKFPSTVELESNGVITSSNYTASIVSNSQGLYLQATMNDDSSVVGGKTIRITYIQNSDSQNSYSWICSPGYPDGMDNKYLPPSCRNYE